MSRKRIKIGTKNTNGFTKTGVERLKKNRPRARARARSGIMGVAPKEGKSVSSNQRFLSSVMSGLESFSEHEHEDEDEALLRTPSLFDEILV
jgi:hypothetical protein